MFRKILFFGLLVMTASCSQWRMKRQLEAFGKETILLPQDLVVVQEGVLTDSIDPGSLRPVKLVLYFSPERCTSCLTGRLEEYERLFELSETTPYSPMLLFSPGTEERAYKTLLTDLRIREMAFPVYIDPKNEFRPLNPRLPEDIRFHVFLLDKHNRVVLVGNPLGSDAMWNLFKSTLDNMLAHDGVFVPEK